MPLPIHIAAGGLAIVLGAVALLIKKGGTLHRRSGLLFVYAMLVMGISAAILGQQKGGADGNCHGRPPGVFCRHSVDDGPPRVPVDSP